MKPILVTGIKPTGDVHLGNYVGVIRPCLSYISTYDCRFFVANYHALNIKIPPPELKKYTQKVAMILLSCGFLEKNCLLFNQSDIPEVLEMSVLLANFALKSRLNGSHAYKAAIAKNKEYQRADDHGINAGLYFYPILMAADILSHNAAFVPIGKDQTQHLEIAKELAQAVNTHCNQEVFSVPKEIIQEDHYAMVLGTDGRKMSKSYENTIDLIGTESSLKKQIQSIITTSQTVDEKKDPKNCVLFSIFSLFASKQEVESFQKKYLLGGLAWGYAKNMLQEILLRELTPIWQRYRELQDNPSVIEQLLERNNKIIRSDVLKNLQIVKKAMGLL